MTVATTRFQIEAIPADDLAVMRATGRDGTGNPFQPFDTETGSEPLRCCLRLSRPGERVALVAYQPPGGAGPYQETGPVFVHAARCDGYPDDAGWPPEFRNRQQVLRGYDQGGRIVDALLVDGIEAERGTAALLDDPRVAVIQSRNVLYGCYMFAIHHRHRPAKPG